MRMGGSIDLIFFTFFVSYSYDGCNLYLLNILVNLSYHDYSYCLMWIPIILADEN